MDTLIVVFTYLLYLRSEVPKGSVASQTTVTKPSYSGPSQPAYGQYEPAGQGCATDVTVAVLLGPFD